MKENNILIVDDSIFMRKQIMGMLAHLEASHCLEAKNGEECLALYKEHRPDLVLLDITMPDKSGVEVLAELLVHDVDANVIMCSAMGQENMITKALRIGAKDFIVKPFKEASFLEVIKAHLFYGES